MEDNFEINNDSEYIIIPNPIYDDSDDYLKILIKRDNTISALEMKLELKAKEVLESQQVISEKELVISEKEQELEKNRQIITELARTLKENNVPAEIIQSKTSLPLEVIRGL